MELGQKLKQARLELGLSQRQLCGDVITRNMLSLIENGAASPSMDTLRYLASRLGKPMGYFLGEEALASPNQAVMDRARSAFDREDYDQVLKELGQYQRPDPIFDREEALLQFLSLLNLAEAAISRGKRPYVLELLDRAKAAGEQTPYCTKELERRRLLALAQVMPSELPPIDDGELMIRAEVCLNQGKTEEAVRYLEVSQARGEPHWSFLRGQAYLAERNYSSAQACLEAAWDYDPRRCAEFLELCCRQQEDFKGAYRYACFLRDEL